MFEPATFGQESFITSFADSDCDLRIATPASKQIMKKKRPLDIQIKVGVI